jgi:hypothetical protein
VLRAWLRAFSVARPRWGWRRAAVMARSEGWVVNNKRIHRLWRAEGLKVPYRKRKKRLRGQGAICGAMCPIRPNVLWALDFQFDQTSNGRTLKLLNVIDEFTRECPAIVVARNIDADGVVAALDPGLLALRQRSRVHRECCRRLVPLQRHRDGGYRPGITLAKCLDRVILRPAARRVPQQPSIRFPARSPGADRGLENRLQHEPSSFGHWASYPSRRALPSVSTLTETVCIGKSMS